MLRLLGNLITMRRIIPTRVHYSWHTDPIMEDVRNPRSFETLHFKTRELRFLSPFTHVHYLSTFQNFTIAGMSSLLARDHVIFKDTAPISCTEFGGRTLVLDEV